MPTATGLPSPDVAHAETRVGPTVGLHACATRKGRPTLRPPTVVLQGTTFGPTVAAMAHAVLAIPTVDVRGEEAVLQMGTLLGPTTSVEGLLGDVHPAPRRPIAAREDEVNGRRTKGPNASPLGHRRKGLVALIVANQSTTSIVGVLGRHVAREATTRNVSPLRPVVVETALTRGASRTTITTPIRVATRGAMATVVPHRATIAVPRLQNVLMEVEVGVATTVPDEVQAPRTATIPAAEEDATTLITDVAVAKTEEVAVEVGLLASATSSPSVATVLVARPVPVVVVGGTPTVPTTSPERTPGVRAAQVPTLAVRPHVVAPVGLLPTIDATV